MSAIELLKSQHRTAEQLLQKIREVSGGARVRLIGDLAEALTLHAALEERYFYPVLRVEGLGDLVDRSNSDHGEVKRLVSDILEMKQRDPRLGQLLDALEQAVQRHIAEEEGVVFPRALEVTDEAVLRSAEEEMRRGMRQIEEKELLELADEQEGAVPT